jgi:hypothetical protein
MRTDIALAATVAIDDARRNFSISAKKRNFPPRKKRFWKRHAVP